MPRPHISRAVMLTALLLIFQNVPAQSTQRAARTQQTWNWSECFYTPLDDVEGFPEFDNFYFVYYTFKPKSGAVSARAAARIDSYDFATLKVSGDDFSFTSLPVRGIKYSFDGRMLKRPTVDPQTGEVARDAVAEGTLRRFRRGRQVAEARVSFGCDAGGEDDQ